MSAPGTVRRLAVGFACAWIVWGSGQGGYVPVESYATFAECKDMVDRVMQREGRKFDYVCLPDTIDPRRRS